MKRFEAIEEKVALIKEDKVTTFLCDTGPVEATGGGSSDEEEDEEEEATSSSNPAPPRGIETEAGAVVPSEKLLFHCLITFLTR